MDVTGEGHDYPAHENLRRTTKKDFAFEMSGSNLRFGAGVTSEVGLDLRRRVGPVQIQRVPETADARAAEASKRAHLDAAGNLTAVRNGRWQNALNHPQNGDIVTPEPTLLGHEMPLISSLNRGLCTK